LQSGLSSPEKIPSSQAVHTGRDVDIICLSPCNRNYVHQQGTFSAHQTVLNPCDQIAKLIASEIKYHIHANKHEEKSLIKSTSNTSKFKWLSQPNRHCKTPEARETTDAMNRAENIQGDECTSFCQQNNRLRGLEDSQATSTCIVIQIG
jgi:hypothetical protein